MGFGVEGLGFEVAHGRGGGRRDPLPLPREDGVSTSGFQTQGLQASGFGASGFGASGFGASGFKLRASALQASGFRLRRDPLALPRKEGISNLGFPASGVGCGNPRF